MNHSCNCGKNVWKKKHGPKSKGNDCGLQEQNRIFFFFGINLSYNLYAMTNKLSKLLQSTKMPTIKRKKCPDLVIDTLESMRDDEDFDSFFEVVQKAADPIKPVEKPTLPRKHKKRSLSLRNSSRLFKQMYFWSS